jgi:hypothetical protein
VVADFFDFLDPGRGKKLRQTAPPKNNFKEEIDRDSEGGSLEKFSGQLFRSHGLIPRCNQTGNIRRCHSERSEAE